LALGVGPHKDSSAITVLAQDDVGGLEVKRKPDGQWIPVKPIPDAYIINVGDVIQVILLSSPPPFSQHTHKRKEKRSTHESVDAFAYW